MDYTEDILDVLKDTPQTFKAIRMALYHKYQQYFSQAAFFTEMLALKREKKIVMVGLEMFSLPERRVEEKQPMTDAEFGKLNVAALQVQRDLLANSMDSFPLNDRLHGLIGTCDAMLKYYKEELPQFWK